ncbi:MAG: sterol desaturase family protein [Chitinophagales bacterium]|nr:sterol desaturase family protein [Chitinophagales bacterium]
MQRYIDLIAKAYSDYANYLWYSITHPGWDNFFYWVLGVSLFFYILELTVPWRKDQPKVRKDFWLDLFYVFFNFFLFPLLLWQAGETIISAFYKDFVGLLGIENPVLFDISELPRWAYFFLLFIIADFLSWWVHRMLHRVPFMWEWHKVHHSVEQMGFAAHVRYHWMENVIYWSFRFIPLTIIGYNLVDIFAIHVFNMAWGHFNHSNISVPNKISAGVLGLIIGIMISLEYSTGIYYSISIVLLTITASILILGPYMKKLFNSPEMHIWHHAKEIPNKYGVNFGLTLAIWDYIFRTAYWPFDGKDIPLGFPGVQKFPDTFLQQISYGFGKKNLKNKT